MNFNITALELWIWRLVYSVLILFSIILGMINYSDNRQQDKLIFKTIDMQSKIVDQISTLTKQNSNTVQILGAMTEKITGVNPLK